jgi:hypothetical protein
MPRLFFRSGRSGRDRESRSEAAAARYGVVLLLLVLTFVVLACGFTTPWAHVVTVALLGATLLVVMAAAEVRWRIRRIVRVVVVVCVVGSLVTVPLHGGSAGGAAAILNGLLVAASPVVITASIIRRRVIDVQTIMGALCIYVLIGLFAAFVYTAMGSIGNHPFFVQQPTATSADYVYFSFVTLATVGYGDLTAAQNPGRAISVLEALTGQIYLVTVVALLVSNFGRNRSTAEGPIERELDKTVGNLEGTDERAE